jgi:DNA polymerase (family 10)
MPLNQEVAELFGKMAALMELKGENQFKVIAFSKVSRIIRDFNIDLKKCIDEGTLCDIEGIGKSSQKIIEEFVQSGKSTDFEELAKTVPAGLTPLLTIEGLGPKTINLLWHECDITSLDELEKAIADGRIAGLKGMGDKKIDNMKKGIEAYKSRLARPGSAPVRVGIAEALVPAEELLAHVRKIPGILRAEIAGSLRRRRETVADVDIVSCTKDSSAGEKITAAFVKLPGIIQVVGQGATKASVKISNGMQVDLRVVPEANYGAALMYFTGSKDHNVKVRGLALKKKMTLNEWGLYKLSDYDKADKEIAHAPKAKPAASRTEQEIYEKVGLAFIPPEMREDRGEIDAALSGRLPRLIELKDIRGDLHTHTTASDGTASIEEMAEAAKARGYEFLAITDHSKTQVIANGLSPERLVKHVAQIRKIGDKLKGITLLAGTECDIMADGRMDYEDAILKDLDIVIASPHVALKQDPAKATDRLLRAIDNKYVTVIGHPTGRLINRRDGLSPDMARIIKAACQSGTALEINASYPRLDLNDVNARAAADGGCRISINTDAHSTSELELITFGIVVARRAWLTPQKVINCMSLEQLTKFISVKRGRL